MRLETFTFTYISALRLTAGNSLLLAATLINILFTLWCVMIAKLVHPAPHCRVNLTHYQHHSRKHSIIISVHTSTSGFSLANFAPNLCSCGWVGTPTWHLPTCGGLLMLYSNAVGQGSTLSPNSQRYWLLVPYYINFILLFFVHKIYSCDQVALRVVISVCQSMITHVSEW